MTKSAPNTPYTSPITHAMRGHKHLFVLNTENYIKNLQTALLDSAFDRPLNCYYAAHNAKTNHWLFSAFKPTRHPWGQYKARGTTYSVPSSLPQLPHPIRQHSPIFALMYLGRLPWQDGFERLKATWNILEPMQRYKAHNRRQPKLTDPYVRSRINQLQERPP